MAIKYNEQVMKKELEVMLLPGEESLCPVYCIYKKSGFFARPQDMKSAFVTITNTGRLFLIQLFWSSMHRSAYALSCVKKLKYKKNIFGQYEIDATFAVQGQDVRIKLQMAPKMVGSNFPNQSIYVEKLLYILDRYVTD